MTAVQTCVNILPDIMARNPQNLARDEAAASNNIARGFVYPTGVSNVSLYHTGPNRDYTRGSLWNRNRGQQYFSGVSGRSDTQARYPDRFQNISQAHVISPDSSAVMLDHSMYAQGNASQWSATSDFAPEGGIEMSRWASQGSFHSGQGAIHGTDSHDQASSSQLHQSLSQISFPLLPGNPGFQGNSNGAAMYPSSSTAFEDFSAHHEEGNALFSVAEPFGNEAFESSSGCQQRTPISEDCRFGVFSTVSEDASFTPTIDGHSRLMPSNMSEASIASSLLSDQPPYGWEGNMSYSDSAQNSPHFTTNEPWSGAPIIASSPSPRDETASDLKNLSPRINRKNVVHGAREGSKQGDIDIFDESYQLTRQAVEMDNVARADPLYQNATPGKDGLYHCPWEGQSICQHKGEKLKCNYDKFVDSHLKPYRCKVPQCENARFSSTACLLRHEREAHAMHGHGDKPFLCTHEGCERGVIGNGFPRHWNLRDHMKRVHNDTGPVPRSNASGSPTPSNAVPTRAPRKRKNEVSTGDKEKEPVIKKQQTVSVAASSPPQQNATPEEPSLVDQWQQRKTNLLQLVQQLDDPRSPGVMQLLISAGKEVQVLAGTSRRINNAPAMKRNASQQSSG